MFCRNRRAPASARLPPARGESERTDEDRTERIGPKEALALCLAIPGQIVEFVPDQPLLAQVNVAGVKRKVNIGLLEGEEVRPGDWVLIHVGFALSKVSETAARDQLRMLAALGEDEKAIEEVRGYMFAEPGEAP
jgi:hydrogenase expression/formation protein HypC